jgi:hypothetical protein
LKQADLRRSAIARFDHQGGGKCVRLKLVALRQARHQRGRQSAGNPNADYGQKAA